METTQLLQPKAIPIFGGSVLLTNDMRCAWCNKKAEGLKIEHFEEHRYYDQLHELLAEKYFTTPEIIAAIRGTAIPNGMRREHLMDYFIEKMKTKKSEKKLARYKEILVMLGRFTNDEFEDICTFELEEEGS